MEKRLHPRQETSCSIKFGLFSLKRKYPCPLHINSATISKPREVAVVQQVLQLLDNKTGTHGTVSYDILGTTIEDIFLDLMSKNKLPDSDEQDDEKVSRDTLQVVSPHWSLTLLEWRWQAEGLLSRFDKRLPSSTNACS